ncbi:uncharacterized protein LOC120277920 [Dioscorea cayenensis subsp. rotundata]|uniref:Uncharacterized protein LOC120277920 n=1 Tax=Dioscorea cayennensis subsp. rotundata TaxID=55577 RepID=A0AB40CMY4_DIOCR|nr:uncharacterized protein LOC120277920 [Dioscorea cayenensis subsp. rotundata]
MSTGCKNSVSCVDSRAPVRASYINLYKWPDSDFEFVRSVTGKPSHGGRRRWSESPRVVDSYSCRQMYLRSYTFSKKETVNEKTRKCLAKVKVKMMNNKRNEKKMKMKNKKKDCVVVVKTVVCSLFQRLLSCTTSVDVVDEHHSFQG